MTTLVIPTRTDSARYTMAVALEKQTYRFDFEWNDRDASWSFDIYDVNNVILLAGRKVVLGYPLIARYRDPRLPPGDISAIDTSGADLDPLFADLGDRVQLLYTESADIPAFLKTGG